jgi:hypothetical protein
MPGDREFFESAFPKPPPAAAPYKPVIPADVTLVPTPPEVDDEEADLALLPPAGKSASELQKQAMLEAAAQRAAEADDEEPEESATQFSIKELMQVTAFAAVGFAIMRWFPADLLAGALGLAAIIGMGILTVAKPQKAFFYLAWWTLLAVYVIVSIVAVINKKP